MDVEYKSFFQERLVSGCLLKSVLWQSKPSGKRHSVHEFVVSIQKP